MPIDTAFLSAKALEELPNGVILAEGATIFDRLSGELQAVANQLAAILAAADTDLSALRARWDERRQAADATYERLLRELQKSKVDGAEFIRLRQQSRSYDHCVRRRTLSRATLLPTNQIAARCSMNG